MLLSYARVKSRRKNAFPKAPVRYVVHRKPWKQFFPSLVCFVDLIEEQSFKFLLSQILKPKAAFIQQNSCSLQLLLPSVEFSQGKTDSKGLNIWLPRIVLKPLIIRELPHQIARGSKQTKRHIWVPQNLGKVQIQNQTLQLRPISSRVIKNF